MQKRRHDSGVQKNRIKVIEDFTCQVCGFFEEYTTPNGKSAHVIHADHIIDKSDGGTEEMSNLWVLCPNCHAKKTVGIIEVDAENGRVFENGTEVKLHHDYHLGWQ